MYTYILILVIVIIVYLNSLCINEFKIYTKQPLHKTIYDLNITRPSLSKSISINSPSFIYKDMLNIPKNPCY